MPVIDRDLGYDELLRTLGILGSPAVYVGILQKDGAKYTEDGQITLAGYAAVNEFGSADGHTPERSFLRSTVDEHREEYSEAIRQAADGIIDDVLQGAPVLPGVRKRLGQLGNKAAGDVKQKIRDIREPPNAKVTLKRKYPRDNPLIDTGRMRQSISFEVDERGKRGGR